MNDQILESTLRTLPVKVDKVTIEGRPGHWVAQVISPDFAKLDEAERQSMVWGHLLDNLTDSQRMQVEFVFTVAPGDPDE
jgi:acid stress-induced BolA-like protein IbaG/YrbA